MSGDVVENAILLKADLVYGHGILTMMVDLEFAVGCQGFGGFSFEERGRGSAFGMESISRLMKLFEVESFLELRNVPCRARRKDNRVESIGHHLKDRWFSFRELREEMGL